MIAVGIPQESVAMVIRDGIDPKTLREHFRHELDTAMIKAHGKIGGKLFAMALAGNVSALIFIAKTRLGWKEVQVIEGNPDAPLSINLKVNFVTPPDD
ncbi:hypothetical protein LCGC14_1240100 [marine sediment metagenome]|uniref:Uncharacterized protein n=1 Tax=marine sediment metagenome TaxID=412755 RepID=A0A0F9L661_9ZZZZ